MIKTYSSEGIVLSRKNYSEADRILTIYSRHEGKIRLLAKGVRKPKSRKRGHIEVFSKIKFSAIKRMGMDLITEAELINSYDKLRLDLRRTSVAYYLCEVVDKVTREGEKIEVIYNELSDHLSQLEDSVKLKNLRREFVYKVLVGLGFLPEGKDLTDLDKTLSEVTEREISSIRIGRKILT